MLITPETGRFPSSPHKAGPECSTPRSQTSNHDRYSHGGRTWPHTTRLPDGAATPAAGARFDAATEVAIEVRAGEGGRDSKLFTDDVAAMYTRWAQQNGLAGEILAADDDGHWVLKFQGRGAGRAFRHEAGKHCVQRVPPTESSGRRQTSFVRVAVLPIPPRHETRDLPDAEFDVKTQCGRQRAGGQHANKTASAVRMTHRPTGLQVFINGRSQEQNRQEARRILTARVRQTEQDRVHGDYQARRREQLADGGRGDKVRTYNFIDSRVVDHRLGTKTGDIKSVMKGRLDLLLTQ